MNAFLVGDKPPGAEMLRFRRSQNDMTVFFHPASKFYNSAVDATQYNS